MTGVNETTFRELQRKHERLRDASRAMLRSKSYLPELNNGTSLFDYFLESEELRLTMNEYLREIEAHFPEIKR